MKKAHTALALALTASLSASLPPGERYLEAAHIIPEQCRTEIAATMGATALEAIRYDATISDEADAPTKKDNDSKVTGVDRSHLISIDDFVNQMPPAQIEQLEASGIEVSLRSDVNGWHHYAASTEQVLQLAFQHQTVSNPLRDGMYQCVNNEIFSRRTVAGARLPLHILGNGNLCISVDEVAERPESDNDPNLCTARGRHRSSSSEVFLAPNGQGEALNRGVSQAFMHELYHLIINYLDINPPIDERREHAAYEFADVAEDIMDDLAESDPDWQWPLSYTPPQSTTSTPVDTCQLATVTEVCVNNS